MSDWTEFDGSLHFGDNSWIRLEDKLKASEIAAKHNAQLAACAAGAWRTDVENAPRDGSEVIIAWRLPQFGDDPNPIYQNYARWYGRHFGFRDVAINPEYIIAFAIPNPPQVTTGKAFDIPEWRDNDSGGYVQ